MSAGKGKTQSWELIKKFFEGKYPHDIERRFHIWLLNEKKWDEKEQALEDMWASIPYGDPKAVVSSLNNVKERLGLPGNTVKLGRRRLTLRIAAVVIPFLLIAGGYFMVDRFFISGETGMIRMEAFAGSTVTLPDNTVVEITEGTLAYPSEFSGGERKVNLEGSGYFTVAEDTEKPFVVENSYMTVRVTGTEFMFVTDNDNKTASVSLVTGSIDVLIEGKSPVSLEPGNELVYDASTGELTVEPMPKQLTNKEALASGWLVFENATVSEMITAIARSRGYEVEMRKTDIGEKTYNIKFIHSENIEEILGVLNVLTNTNFVYIIENDSIIIE